MVKLDSIMKDFNKPKPTDKKPDEKPPTETPTITSISGTPTAETTTKVPLSSIFPPTPKQSKIGSPAEAEPKQGQVPEAPPVIQPAQLIPAQPPTTPTIGGVPFPLAGSKQPTEPTAIKDEKKKTWLDDLKETQLLFGLPKHGKTWAYCSVIDDLLKKGGHVYVISTDSGFQRTAKAYFGTRIKEVIDKIDVELVYDINSIRFYFDKIRKDLKPNDLLVIDLVSDVWEWAQIDFVLSMCNGRIEEFVVDAMKDVRKFGLFDDNKWNYIKSLHKFVEDIIIRKPCNFIGVANEKESDVEVIKGKKDAKDLLTDLGYEDLGVRAGGMKLLPYKFETVLRIGFDERKYFFQVVGDRGYGRDISKHYYDRNMYDELKRWRKQKSG